MDTVQTVPNLNAGVILLERSNRSKNEPSKIKSNQDRLSKRNSKTKSRNEVKKASSGEKSSRFLCSKCHKTFSSDDSLVQHLEIHIEEERFICDICHEGFVHESSLNSHLLTHSTIESCPSKEKSKTTVCLDKNEKSFKCHLCPKTYLSNYSLKRHVRSHDAKNDRNACRICQKTFPDEKSLRDHRLIHPVDNDGYLYKCLACDRGFNQRYNLTIHERSQSHKLRVLQSSAGNFEVFDNAAGDQVIKFKRT